MLYGTFLMLINVQKTRKQTFEMVISKSKALKVYERHFFKEC